MSLQMQLEVCVLRIISKMRRIISEGRVFIDTIAEEEFLATLMAALARLSFVL